MFSESTYEQAWTIHPATKTHFEQMAELWEASVRATHHFLKEEDIVFFRKALLEYYFPNCKSLFLLKDKQGGITAFVGVNEHHIDMLFIHPSQRGKGLGKRLVRFAVEEFRAHSVDVNEQNGQALGFYQKMGFEVTARDETDGNGKPYPILHMKLNHPHPIHSHE